MSCENAWASNNYSYGCCGSREVCSPRRSSVHYFVWMCFKLTFIFYFFFFLCFWTVLRTQYGRQRDSETATAVRNEEDTLRCHLVGRVSPRSLVPVDWHDESTVHLSVIDPHCIHVFVSSVFVRLSLFAFRHRVDAIVKKLWHYVLLFITLQLIYCKLQLNCLWHMYGRSHRRTTPIANNNWPRYGDTIANTIFLSTFYSSGHFLFFL